MATSFPVDDETLTRWAMRPHIRLLGEIDDACLGNFLDQLTSCLNDGSTDDIVLEIMTPGGDADVGRRIGLEMNLTMERLQRPAIFIGKTIVYSAGVTIMAAFPRERRYLSRDCVLLIHPRKLDKDLILTGPLRSSIQVARAAVAQLELGQRVEADGFDRLIAGSDVTHDEILEQTNSNWYLTAQEALERGLIAGTF